MTKHTIICGLGQNGLQVATALKKLNHPFVAIERDKVIVAEQQKNMLLVTGDAASEEVLQKAEIDKAYSLITTLPNDANNLFIVISARQRCSGLSIISRASSKRNREKMFSAGANHVIMPDHIGGRYMASMLVSPELVAFVEQLSDWATSKEGRIVHIETNALPEPMRNKKIKDIYEALDGITIIGYKSKEDGYVINPNKNAPLAPESQLTVMLNETSEQKLKQLISTA